MKFDEISRIVGGVPFITSDHAKFLYELILEERPSKILELGIAHGTATCYMAAALQEVGGGVVTAVDLVDAKFNPSAEDQLQRANLADHVEIHRMQSGYTWFLHDEIKRNTVRDACAEVYDLCVVDGPKNWTIDGAAFFFVDKLLKPNGWIIFDDYDWTYSSVGKGREITDGISHRTMSDEEIRTPQIREIFDLLVKQHPSYGELKVLNDSWCMARKNFSSEKRFTVVFERSTRDVIAKAVTRAYRKVRSR